MIDVPPLQSNLCVAAALPGSVLTTRPRECTPMLPVKRWSQEREQKGCDCSGFLSEKGLQLATLSPCVWKIVADGVLFAAGRARVFKDEWSGQVLATLYGCRKSSPWLWYVLWFLAIGEARSKQNQDSYDRNERLLNPKWDRFGLAENCHSDRRWRWCFSFFLNMFFWAWDLLSHSLRSFFHEFTSL